MNLQVRTQTAVAGNAGGPAVGFPHGPAALSTQDRLLRLHGAGPGVPVDPGKQGQHTAVLMPWQGRGVNIASDMKLSQFDLISTPTGNETVSLNHGRAGNTVTFHVFVVSFVFQQRSRLGEQSNSPYLV